VGPPTRLVLKNPISPFGGDLLKIPGARSAHHPVRAEAFFL